MVQGRLTSLALRLVPPDWRDAVWADLSEEADAGRHGTGWLNWQIARTAGHLRWNGLLDAMTTDGAMALRSLRRSPGFVLTATTLLALGIGGSTLAFGVLYGVLLRPLPYEEDGRLVVVEAWHVDDTGRRTRRNYSLADLADWERVPAFESVALVKNQSLTLSSSDGLVRLSAAAVTDRFFATMRGSLVAGRGIGPEDGAAFVAVVSSRLWRDRLGAASVDEALTISLDGHAYRVVGVAGPSFQFPSARTDVWLPADALQRLTDEPLRRGSFGFNPVGRLRTGVSLAAAQANLDTLSKQLAEIEPVQYGRMRAEATGLRSRQIAGARPALLMLGLAFGLIFVLACLNVATLFLTRRLGLARERAIRAALGATSRRLLGQALVESLVIVAGGAALGVGLAAWTIEAIPFLQLPGVPRVDAIRLDAPVILFSVAAAAVAVAVATLLPMPALGIARSLSARRTSRDSVRARAAIVGAQIALSAVLLVSAGLLGRTFVRLVRVDIGVHGDGTTVTLLNFTGSDDRRVSDWISLAERITERVRALPGVEEVGLGAAAPPNLPQFRVTLAMPDPVSGQRVEHIVDAVPGTPGFLPALGVPLVSGRLFTAADRADAPPVAILSTDLARRLFGERDPVGRNVPVSNSDGDPVAATVVGVVGPVRYSGLRTTPEGALYRPWAQQPLPSAFLVTHAPGHQADFPRTIRRSIREVEPAVVIASEESVASLRDYEIAAPRFHAALLSLLALLSLTVATVGVYGTVSQAVARRTHEIGVRLALGATPSMVRRHVMTRSLRLAGVGVGVGLGIAWMATGAVSNLLYGVSVSDPLTYAASAGLLLASATGATFGPARRAARTDPAGSLRAE